MGKCTAPHGLRLHVPLLLMLLLLYGLRRHVLLLLLLLHAPATSTAALRAAEYEAA